MGRLEIALSLLQTMLCSHARKFRGGDSRASARRRQIQHRRRPQPSPSDTDYDNTPTNHSTQTDTYYAGVCDVAMN